MEACKLRGILVMCHSDTDYVPMERSGWSPYNFKELDGTTQCSIMFKTPAVNDMYVNAADYSFKMNGVTLENFTNTAPDALWTHTRSETAYEIVHIESDFERMTLYFFNTTGSFSPVLFEVFKNGTLLSNNTFIFVDGDASGQFAVEMQIGMTNTLFGERGSDGLDLISITAGADTCQPMPITSDFRVYMGEDPWLGGYFDSPLLSSGGASNSWGSVFFQNTGTTGTPHDMFTNYADYTLESNGIAYTAVAANTYYITWSHATNGAFRLFADGEADSYYAWPTNTPYTSGTGRIEISHLGTPICDATFVLNVASIINGTQVNAETMDLTVDLGDIFRDIRFTMPPYISTLTDNT